MLKNIFDFQYGGWFPYGFLGVTIFLFWALWLDWLPWVIKSKSIAEIFSFCLINLSIISYIIGFWIVKVRILSLILLLAAISSTYLNILSAVG